MIKYFNCDYSQKFLDNCNWLTCYLMHLESAAKAA